MKLIYCVLRVRLKMDLTNVPDDGRKRITKRSNNFFFKSNRLKLNLSYLGVDRIQSPVPGCEYWTTIFNSLAFNQTAYWIVEVHLLLKPRTVIYGNCCCYKTRTVYLVPCIGSTNCKISFHFSSRFVMIQGKKKKLLVLTIVQPQSKQWSINSELIIFLNWLTSFFPA